MFEVSSAGTCIFLMKYWRFVGQRRAPVYCKKRRSKTNVLQHSEFRCSAHPAGRDVSEVPSFFLALLLFVLQDCRPVPWPWSWPWLWPCVCAPVWCFEWLVACGFVVSWPCGFVALWLCCLVVLLPCGFVALWPCCLVPLWVPGGS